MPLTSNAQQQPTRQVLRDLRDRLLRLHRLLLDVERNTYEQVHGRVTSGELLQLVLNHPQFVWLRRLSELVAQMDELLYAKEPAAPESVQQSIEQLVNITRSLLVISETSEGTPDSFSDRYYAILQLQPDAVIAHSEIVGLLSTIAPGNHPAS